MIIVLTGPTGSGKSKMALSIAQKTGAAIINADAFQVYQELNIATAKPSIHMRSLAPHFLYDFVPLNESYNVVEYQADMRSVLHHCQQQNQHVLIAGGTGLYIRAALYDYEFSPSKPVDLSAYEAMDTSSLHQALADMDPAAAEAIHPNNRQRVLRAIEIALQSGSTKTELEQKQTHEPMFPALFYGIETDRGDLYRAAEQRVDEMFAEGLLEETLPLIERYGRDAMAFRAIGVKELFPYIDGEATLEETKALIKTHTRQYIKRQMTWFAHQFDLTWIRDEDAILSTLR